MMSPPNLSSHMGSYEKLQVAHKFITQSYQHLKPEFAIILGSGLGGVSEIYNTIYEIPYDHIPYIPLPSVEGHEGKLLVVENNQGRQGLIFKGRFHYYEGYSYDQVMSLSRLAALLGVKTLIVTNAAGGINANFHPGDIVLIIDHLNLSGTSPLRGHNIEQLGPRFPDMSDAYCKKLQEKILALCLANKLMIKKGVYCFVAGPTYETPAEIRMFRTLGADMVGMSTVPDVMAAQHAGLKVVALSCITNYAAGLKDIKLLHEDVKEQALKSLSNMQSVIKIITDSCI